MRALISLMVFARVLAVMLPFVLAQIPVVVYLWLNQRSNVSAVEGYTPYAVYAVKPPDAEPIVQYQLTYVKKSVYEKLLRRNKVRDIQYERDEKAKSTQFLKSDGKRSG